jgi:TonB-linked SusC/RagA family outer membrane protein
MKAKLLWRMASVLICLFLTSPLYSFPCFNGAISHKQSQQKVTGEVTDDQGNPLPGVTVAVQGTDVGTTTDNKGNYTLQVQRQQTIVFSFIGYKTQEVEYRGQNHIDIRLEVSATQLNEVVTIGYGTQRKVSLTSAVSEIPGKDLTRRPVNSIQQALQGKLPGLTVLDNGGGPGSPNTDIVIRGVNTPYRPVGLSTGQTASVGDNEPLVIVDGVEQPFQNINPDDIESISVLKDASSTAIYGSRAANGVILITTKRAKEGKISVSYSGFYALQRSVSNPQQMDIKDYLQLENLAYKNVGSSPPYPYRDQDIEKYAQGAVTDPLHYPLPFDWYNTMLHTASQVNHSLSVSGGNEHFQARASLRYQDMNGIIANTNSKLSEARINTNFKVSPKISLSADLDYRYQNTLQPYDMDEVFRQFMQNSIWDVPKYPNGDYGGGAQGNNPLLLAEKGGYSRIASDYMIVNLKGEWQIIKGLTFTTQFSGRTTNVFGKTYQNTWQTKDSTIVKKRNLHNKLTEARNYERNYTLNNLLTYATTLGKHSLKVLAGYSQIDDKTSTLNAYRQDFYNNEIQSISQGASDGTQDNGGGDAQWGLRSYFGRFNYDYSDKYLFEANARYDGSSRFTGNNRYSFFPSFSAGWRIAQEKFWSNLRGIVNELKLRGSWGEVGNQAVALYSYFPTLNLVAYDFNNSPVQGYVQKQQANADLTWETTIQSDVGLDGELLDGRLFFTIDYYKKRTKGILLTLPVPGTLGLQAGPQNAGVVDNKGWEFSVGSHNRFGAFALDASVNLSINENKVVDLAGTGPYLYGSDIDPRYITAEGYPINAFWGYKTDGLFQTDEEAAKYPQFMRPAKAGDVKVLDLNHDGKIDPDDMTYLGNSFPKYSFGATFNLTYKRFALNLAFQGATDVGMRYARAMAEAGNYEGFTPDIYTNNYWTPDHKDAYFARPTKRDLRNQASTDRMILNASYLRLKNFQLLYQLPSSLTGKLFVQKINVYISGTNLLTFSELNKWHMDPESSSGWQNYYPQTSLYTFGINVGF